MATKAPVIVADGMLVVGDVESRKQCLDQVERLKAAGTTFLVSTDVPRKFEGFFDRAIVLHNGGIVADGAVADGLALLRELRLASPAADTGKDDTL